MKLQSTSTPRLASHVRMQWDGARNGWVLQAPERLLYPDEMAVAVLRLCDGARTLQAIVSELAAEYQAPPEAVRDDIVELLQPLADKGLLVDGAA